MSRSMMIANMIKQSGHVADVVDTINVALRAFGEPEIPENTVSASVLHVWADSASNPELRFILTVAERRINDLAA